MHPTTEDSFEVIQGNLDVCVDREWRGVQPGETATVPVVVPHTFRNATDQPVKVVATMRPAGRSEAFFREMHRLIHEGKIRRLPPKDPRSAIYAAKDPRSAIYAAMLIGEYPDEIRTSKPPNGVFKALAVLGKALRFKL